MKSGFDSYPIFTRPEDAVYIVALVLAAALLAIAAYLAPQWLEPGASAALGASLLIGLLAGIIWRQRQFRRSESALKAVVRTLVDGVVDLDQSGNIIGVGDEAAQIFGYAPDEVLGQNIRLLLLDLIEDSQTVLDPDDSSKIGPRLEVIGRRKNGSEFPVDLVILANENGRQVSFSALVCDISEHYLFDKELEQRQQLLESEIARRIALLDRAERVAHIGHWDWDIERESTYWSEELRRIVGRETGEMVATYEDYLNTIIHPDDRREVAKLYARALQETNAPYRSQHRILLPGGEERLVYEHAEITRDETGKPCRITGIVQDASSQTSSESEYEHELSPAIQAERIAKIGHFLYDEREERYIYTSPGCAKIYGLSEQEFLNHYTSVEVDLADIHEQDRDRVKAAYDLYGETGEDCTIEFRIHRPDGEIRWIRELQVAHQMSNGEVTVSRGVIQDITDQKVVENELREASQNLELKVQERTAELAASEERFQLAMQGSNDGLWDWNLVTGQLLYSKRWFGMLGYDEDDWTGTLDTWQRLVNPDDEARVLKLVEDLINGKNPEFRTEFSMRHRDGRWVPILSRAALQRDPETGTPLRLVGTNVDLSEQKKAEALLQASEARIRSLIANIPGVVYSAKADSGYALLYASDYIETLAAYPASDFTSGRKSYFEDIVHPKDRQRVMKEWRDGVRKAGFFEIEYRIIDGNENLHWVLERGQIIRDSTGKATHLDGFIFDISDRAQAEQALKQINTDLDKRIHERTAELDESKNVAISLMQDARREKERAEANFQRLQETMANMEKLQQAVEQSPLSILVFDNKGNIEYANAYTSEISQYDNAELIGAHASVFRSDAHSDEFYQELDDHIARGKPWNGEMWSRRKDGSFYWERCSIAPIFNHKGELVNTVSVRLDMTGQHRMQDALVKAKDQAEAANRAKSSFLAMMSHEIRTPMNGIVGMIDLLGKTSLNDKQQLFTRTAQESAISLLQIINDILDFSKIEAGHLEVESIPVAWVSVIEDVANILSPALLKKGLHLYCTVDANLPQWVSGDPGRFRQILTNLAGNAIKFTESTPERAGEIYLSISQEKESGSDRVRIEVSDNGIGMTEQQVEKLFQPFTQADSSTQRRFGGTGLGLSICARLATIMGGEIGCDSEPGQGSTFWLRLPCEATEPPEGELIENDLGGLKIMLLGNHPILDEFMQPDLTARGAEITRLTGPELALEAAVDKQVDAVLLQADWPQPTRLDLCRSFSQDKRLQNCGIVLPVAAAETGSAADFSGCILPRGNPWVASEIRRAIAIAAGRAERPAVEETPAYDIVTELPSLDEAEANGNLILIVEDNLTNQDVLQQQLNLLGYVAEIANHGLEALERLKSRRYGLVLTDCHMPEMDGYELTGAIREQELESASRMPIIAITANALLGEADRCLAAGMDDYLSKPVQLDRLRQKLRGWLPLPATGSGKNPAISNPNDEDLSAGQASVDSPAIDHKDAGAVIDRDLLARFLGDDEKIQDMFLHKFVSQSESVVEAVNAAVNDEAWAEVGAQAHKLKSSSRSVGAVALADLCAELEQAGKSADVGTIKDLSPRLGEAYGQVREYVKALD